MEHYDLIVLGSGSAARDAAAKAASKYGAKVALVETTRWGGSCPNVACKPTKAYLVVAELVHDINELAGKLGIEVGPATIDMARVKARKDSLKKAQPKWVEDLSSAGFETYDGEASLVDAQTVKVGEEELTAEHILIATGSRTAIPPIQGIEEIDWVDHVSALELTELPESLLVVGAGPVGLEFAQIFARFGSRVTIVQSPDRISPRSDGQAADVLQAALEADGIEVILSSRVKAVVRDGDEIVATVAPKDGNGSRELRVTHVLLASGRVPNVEALRLEELGIERDRMGIVIDEHMRTGVDGIWAAGDVTGRHQFTPIAQYQARIAVDDMFGGDAPAADYSVLPTAIFTEPELAGVGLTEEEAQEQGIEHEIVVHDIKYVQRSSYKDQKLGLYKVLYDPRSRRVLGLHVVAPGGSDVVQGFSLALRLDVTVDDLARMHHVFPTFGEGLKAAAEQALPEPAEMVEIVS
ncbi:MAG TPA: NAD(P)/FAD-dependent oxidoreductase [Gaiellaceae bacterium]|nr:NAD(P)/FAD-dependent oxidoreductase [Gaiellaceae bacterium]